MRSTIWMRPRQMATASPEPASTVPRALNRNVHFRTATFLLNRSWRDLLFYAAAADFPYWSKSTCLKLPLYILMSTQDSFLVRKCFVLHFQSTFNCQSPLSVWLLFFVNKDNSAVRINQFSSEWRSRWREFGSYHRQNENYDENAVKLLKWRRNFKHFVGIFVSVTMWLNNPRPTTNNADNSNLQLTTCRHFVVILCPNSI